MRKLTFTRKIGLAIAALALSTSPAMAQQDEEIEQAAAFAETMRLAFNAEPLTAEQEARLPAAQAVVEKVMPDGSYARMMNDVIDNMLGPMTAMMPETMPAGEIASTLGLETEALDGASEAELARISNLLDPSYNQRGSIAMTIMMDEMMGLMDGMEPAMRSGLARAYAVRFTDTQLADIAAFFATPTGDFYATESMMVFTDPQVMSASMELMPVFMDRMPNIVETIERAMDQLPPVRGYDDLSAAERGELADLTGQDTAALKQGMADAGAP